MYNFTSPKTKATYYLNTANSDAGTAEQFCQRNGGHLAIYTSHKEQIEVEAAFTTQGGLIPLYHNIYWFGLRAQQWPDFQWPDKTVASPRENATYSAWTATQPDNAGDGQLCTAGNYSGLLKSGAWGWSDESCATPLVYVCEVSGEWPPAAGAVCEASRPRNMLSVQHRRVSCAYAPACRRLLGCACHLLCFLNLLHASALQAPCKRPASALPATWPPQASLPPSSCLPLTKPLVLLPQRLPRATSPA